MEGRKEEEEKVKKRKRCENGSRENSESKEEMKKYNQIREESER